MALWSYLKPDPDSFLKDHCPYGSQNVDRQKLQKFKPSKTLDFFSTHYSFKTACFWSPYRTTYLYKQKGTFFTLKLLHLAMIVQKKSSSGHFRFKYPTPPRKWSNSLLPWHKWWSNVPGRMFLSVHDTSACQEINCFSLEKPKVKRENPQKTHLFIFICTLTTVPFPVLSRRQQKYKRQEKITDLISRRNESNILCINASFSLITEA